MHSDVFKLYSEIIELSEKPQVPIGEMGQNVEGTSFEFKDEDKAKRSYRAIVDIGLLDVEQGHLFPVDEDLSMVGASSDMFVIDLGDNSKNYKVGDLLEFNMDYMGVLRSINSRYIDKRVK
jgi:predicted amino acid racemase